MLKTYISAFFISILLCCGASPQAPVADVDADENIDVDVEKVENFIERIDTLGLKILHPKFSRMRSSDGKTLCQARQQSRQSILELQQIHRDRLQWKQKYTRLVNNITNEKTIDF